MSPRPDQRSADAVRPITITRQYTRYALGSVLIEYGHTKVICTASIENSVPPFLRGQGRGWLTAEYAMLPSATHDRSRREVNRGKPSGRTSEIQRLIGRSFRAAVDLDQLGERTMTIDADVIQADGGTRTAAITGGMIALTDAVSALHNRGEDVTGWIQDPIAAVSVGIVDGEVRCDLCYDEDSQAQVDMNVVMTASGRFIEIQGTAEQQPFSGDQLTDMIQYAKQGITSIFSSIQ